MTHREAAALAVFAVLLIVAAAVWLFGPYGLLAAGLALLAVALLGPLGDVKEAKRGKSAAAAARPR